MTKCETFNETEWEKLPVLVEATTAFFGQMLSPNLDQRAATEWSFDVTDSTNNNHWWCFNDGDSFNNFFLVDLYEKAKDTGKNKNVQLIPGQKNGEKLWEISFESVNIIRPP